MSRIGVRRPSPALPLSAGALFLALGGAAYAVPVISSPGASKPVVVRTEFKIPADRIRGAWAKCPRGTFATGGGVAEGRGTGKQAYVLSDEPDTTSGRIFTGSHPTQWFGSAQNLSTTTRSELVWVVCMR